MRGTERISRVRVSIGLVHCVDTINREVAVLVDGELLTFDVPAGCRVILRGEPVKLRMVQPQDRVKITHIKSGVLRVARTVEIRSDDIDERPDYSRSPEVQLARR